MAEYRLLHVMPTLNGGGPEHTVAGLAALLGPSFAHTVLALDGRMHPQRVVRLRRLGVSARIVDPDDAVDALHELAGRHDATMVHWWQHPGFHRLLATMRPMPARVALVVHSLGLRPPQWIDPEMAAAAHMVVTTSRRTSAAFTASPGFAGRGNDVRMCHAPLDPQRLGGPGDPARQSHIGYVGTVNRSKLHIDTATLCESIVDAAPTARFRFVGGGDPSLAPLVHSGVATCQPYTHEVGDTMRSFGVFGYPVCAEGSSTADLSLREAMWLGVPTMLLGGSALDDVVDRTFIADDARAYVDRVAALVSSPELRAREGSAAMEFARDAFDPRRSGWREAVTDLLEMSPATVGPLAAVDADRGVEIHASAIGRAANELTPSWARTLDWHGLHGEGGLAHAASWFADDPRLQQLFDAALQSRDNVTCAPG